MDINSAEKSLKKLLTYATDLANTKPKLYQKSRDRLIDLVATCNEIVTLISSVLQEETMFTEVNEFSSTAKTTNPDIFTALDTMQAQIDQIRSFAKLTDAPTLVGTQQAGTCISGVTSKPSNIIPITNQVNSASGSSSKKSILKSYTSAISHVADIKFHHKEVSCCANLLWYWFDNRFIVNGRSDGFVYNMKRFPTWIRDIVILYGNAIHDKSYHKFDQTFRSWVDKLSSTDCKYAVPFEVYEFGKSIDASKLTLDAVVLWDILVDSGLSDICTQSTDDSYLSTYSVYDLCSKLNPELLNDYRNYLEYPEMIDVLLGWEKVI